jgi:hypothetical protein
MSRFVNLLLSLVLGLPNAAHADCESEALRSKLGERFSFTRDLAKRTRSEIFDTRFAGHVGARWLRFRFLVRPDPVDAPWSLTIRDKYGRVLESYGPGDIASADLGTIWSGRLPANEGILFDTWPADLPENFGLEVREYIAMVDPTGEGVFYSTAVEGEERWKTIHETPLQNVDKDWIWMRQADSVGLVMPSWDRENRGCTGFAVASNLLLTNWHCGWVQTLSDTATWTQRICNDTLIDFSFDEDQRSAEYRCSSVLQLNKDLDYVLLQIEAIDPARHLRGLTLASAPREKGTHLAVLHHPAGLRKQISRECEILEAEKEGWQQATPTRFTHLCDTAPGSSGAPVFEAETGLVIGLHHRGVEREPNPPCRPNEDPRRNKAIWMGAIIADLQMHQQKIEAKLGQPLILQISD